MIRRYRREIIIAAVAVLAVLGVGAITFLWGSDDEINQVEVDYVDLDLSTVKGSSRPAEEVLFLPWGDGPLEASRLGETATRSTIEAVFGSDGAIFVVDHPADLFGARVRWFSGEGVLLGTLDTPGGSTHFRPHPNGFNYVVAKSGGPSEKAVLFDIESSVATTYTIPLSLNSGGLVYSDGVLYATATPSDVDYEEQVIYSREVLVPVARDGVQVEDAAADENAIELWGFGWDGRPYTFEARVLGLEPSVSDVVTLVGSEGRSIRVPRRYRLLGVDDRSLLYLAAEPQVDRSRPRQLSAGWISANEPHVEVLVADLDAQIDSAISLPFSHVSAWQGRMPMHLSEDGLYSIREVEGGLAVVVHQFD